MSRRVGPLAALAIMVALGAAPGASCSKSEVKSTAAAGDPAPARPSFTLFAVAEVRGQIGPCGCTTDPLGDLSRTAQLVASARAAGPVLFVDAGSLLYAHAPTPPQLAVQEELKADLLAQTYQKTLLADAVGLGPADLPSGAASLDHLRLPRLVANAPAGAGNSPSIPRGASPPAPPAEPSGSPPPIASLRSSKLIDVGGAKAGVLAVIAPGAVTGISLSDPVAAGKQAVAQLRGQGAQVVIGLVQAQNKRDAVKLVRDIGGIDLAIAGLGLEAPEPERTDSEPQKVGDGWLVAPANRGQIVAKFEVALRGPGPLADAIGPAAAAAKLAGLDRQLAALDADLKAFASDKAADPAFVARKQQERTERAAERDRLKAHPVVVPPHGSYFTLEQVRIHKALACNTAVQDAISAFFRQSGEANVKAAEKIAVSPPPKGQASYTGTESCADCHDDQVAFWKKTVHATAWQTLVDRGQQFDLDCIGCHVTGWDKPGGSNLGHNDPLRDVQCETCHGPGSIHVAKGGKEKPFAIQRAPEDKLCASQCHTKEHSDTFQLEAYLRDVLGPGHGEDRRKKLGDGPTGAQLRKAALDKAGRTLGAGCTR
jgi:cytochrome c5